VNAVVLPVAVNVVNAFSFWDWAKVVGPNNSVQESFLTRKFPVTISLIISAKRLKIINIVFVKEGFSRSHVLNHGHIHLGLQGKIINGEI
jgi:hypothetical protein